MTPTHAFSGFRWTITGLSQCNVWRRRGRMQFALFSPNSTFYHCPCFVHIHMGYVGLINGLHSHFTHLRHIIGVCTVLIAVNNVMFSSKAFPVKLKRICVNLTSDSITVSDNDIIIFVTLEACQYFFRFVTKNNVKHLHTGGWMYLRHRG